ncbi:MAG: flagellar hook-length control protein FliK [Rhodoferax sp.]
MGIETFTAPHPAARSAGAAHAGGQRGHATPVAGADTTSPQGFMSILAGLGDVLPNVVGGLPVVGDAVITGTATAATYAGPATDVSLSDAVQSLASTAPAPVELGAGLDAAGLTDREPGIRHQASAAADSTSDPLALLSQAASWGLIPGSAIMAPSETATPLAGAASVPAQASDLGLAAPAQASARPATPMRSAPRPSLVGSAAATDDGPPDAMARPGGLAVAKGTAPTGDWSGALPGGLAVAADESDTPDAARAAAAEPTQAAAFALDQATAALANAQLPPPDLPRHAVAGAPVAPMRPAALRLQVAAGARPAERERSESVAGVPASPVRVTDKSTAPGDGLVPAEAPTGAAARPDAQGLIDAHKPVAERAALVLGALAPSPQAAMAFAELSVPKDESARKAGSFKAGLAEPLTLPQSALPVAAGMASTLTATPAAPVETLVAQQVAYWVSNQVQNAELRLDGLGGTPVEVSISLQGNAAQVAFRSDEAATRAILEQASSQLKDALQREGLVLSGVSVGTSGNGEAGTQERRPRLAARQTALVTAPVVLAGARQDPTRVAGRALDLFV